jgi:hypothetical protein
MSSGWDRFFAFSNGMAAGTFDFMQGWAQVAVMQPF